MTHSIADSIDLTCQIHYPATSCFVSVNGRSITLRWSPEILTRFPLELGWRTLLGVSILSLCFRTAALGKPSDLKAGHLALVGDLLAFLKS